MTPRRLAPIVALALTAAALMACSSSNNTSNANTPVKAPTTASVAATRAATPAAAATVAGSPAARPASPTVAGSPAARPAGSPAAAAAGAATFPADSFMATIQKAGKIRVGVKFDAPPMGALNPTRNQPEGFDIELAHQIAKAILGDENKVEFTESITANREPFLTQDKVDMVIATYTITDARRQVVDFSKPYYLAGQSILVRKDNTDIKTPADMNGKKVCAQQNSTSADNIKAAAPQADLLLLPDTASCAAALADKRVDAFSTDDIQLIGINIKDPNATKLTGGVFSKEPYGIGVKKGHPEFVQFVNDQLAAMEKDGRWKAYYDKWLGKYTPVTADEALQRVLSAQ